VSRFSSLLLAEADDADLRVRKDGWGNHATISDTRFFFRERVVRRDTAIVTAYWPSHLAFSFSIDHVSTGEYVRGVGAKVLVNLPCTAHPTRVWDKKTHCVSDL
jgi:hypothetical protein